MAHSRREFMQRAVLGGSALAVGSSVAGEAHATPALPEDRVFEGTLTAVGSDRLVLAVDGAERVLAISGKASVWRGGETGLDVLAPGQDTLVRLDAAGEVERVWSDLTRATGVVVGVSGQDHSLLQRDGSEVSVRIDAERIERGQTIDVIGLRQQQGVVCTNLLGAHTSSPQPDEMTPLDFVYEGHATWFHCSTGAGRCGTCNTGSSRQLAWPALDTCGACSFSCCDCSRTCVRQVHLSCGRRRIDVRDLGNNRLAQDLVIVDCGPNQNSLCSGSCPRRVVDLTRPTFARFRDPAQVGCFRCRARVNT